MTTSIEWTDETWNPLVGCSRVSSGCMNCYAEKFAHRGMSDAHRGLTQLSSQGPQWTGEIRFVPEKLEQPLRWKKARRVFVNSMSDLFHEKALNDVIDQVMAVMLLSPRHTFQVLTKRPERMRAYLSDHELYSRVLSAADEIRYANPKLHNVAISNPALFPAHWIWWGVSAEDQRTAERRIPILLDTPAAVRFVSAEPLLGPLEFGTHLGGVRLADGERWRGTLPLLDWVIVGGETGPSSRELDLAWARGIVRQCRDAQVACFVKQLGAKPVGWAHDGRPPVLGGQLDSWPADLQVRQFPEVARG